MATQGQTMSLPDQATNAVRMTVGATAATNPFWLDPSWLSGPYQLAMAAGGGLVLVLTIRKLWRENQALDRQRQRDMDKGQ
jgi:hypothetical protein